MAPDPVSGRDSVDTDNADAVDLMERITAARTAEKEAEADADRARVDLAVALAEVGPADGITIADVCDELGLHRQGIYAIINRHHPDRSDA